MTGTNQFTYKGSGSSCYMGYGMGFPNTTTTPGGGCQDPRFSSRSWKFRGIAASNPQGALAAGLGRAPATRGLRRRQDGRLVLHS